MSWTRNGGVTCYWITDEGEVWSGVHAAQSCVAPCVIHSPSKHRMRAFPMHLRETGLVERMCEHGVGHPDPDSAAYMDRVTRCARGTWSTHGCDGCCAKRDPESLRQAQDAPEGALP